MNRKKKAALAQETLSIIEKGFYLSDSGRKIEIRADLDNCVAGTVVYTEGDLARLTGEVPAPVYTDRAAIEVTQETTLEAAFRLGDELPGGHVVCLNFASAKHPGGGFLSGSQAQEESLARSSALYVSIKDGIRCVQPVFRAIVFAVPGKAADNLNAFARRFGVIQ